MNVVIQAPSRYKSSDVGCQFLDAQSCNEAREIEGMRQEMRELTTLVSRLALEVARLSDRQTSERERLQLWVENQLLRFERRLPPKDSEGNDN